MVNSEEFRKIQIEESKFEKFNNLKTILEIDSQSHFRYSVDYCGVQSVLGISIDSKDTEIGILISF